MYSYLFINNLRPEFAEVLLTRPIKIHEFHSTGEKPVGIKRFMGVNFMV